MAGDGPGLCFVAWADTNLGQHSGNARAFRHGFLCSVPSRSESTNTRGFLVRKERPGTSLDSLNLNGKEGGSSPEEGSRKPRKSGRAAMGV